LLIFFQNHLVMKLMKSVHLELMEITTSYETIIDI